MNKHLDRIQMQLRVGFDVVHRSSHSLQHQRVIFQNENELICWRCLFHPTEILNPIFGLLVNQSTIQNEIVKIGETNSIGRIIKLHSSFPFTIKRFGNKRIYNERKERLLHRNNSFSLSLSRMLSPRTIRYLVLGCMKEKMHEEGLEPSSANTLRP